MNMNDLPTEPTSILSGHAREKRSVKLVLLGMALLVILFLSFPLARVLFTIGVGLLLLTWADYAAQDRGKPMGIVMKVMTAIGGMVLAQVYMRIIAMIPMQIVGGVKAS